MYSTFCKIHKHATGARKILGNQNISVSRGGKTTKIYANFQFVKVILSAGNFHDSEFALDLLKGVNLECKAVLADKAYCSAQIRDYVESCNAICCISDKSNSVLHHNFDKELYKARNIIERFFQRIKNFRHIATRYDKLSICFQNFVLLGAIMLQL